MNNTLINKTPQPAPARAAAKAADVIRFPGAQETAGDAQLCLTSADIAQALKDKRLVMHYQPQYELGSGRVIGAEALVRIVDPAGELVFPDRFIEEAETGAVSVAFGREVIRQTLAQLADCRGRGVALPRVAINLSGHQLEADAGLARFVTQTLSRFGLAHGDVEFELTERQKLTRRGRRLLEQLADRGSRVVLDDICTGYASVQHLNDLPVSGFKLDRKLVGRVGHEAGVEALVDGLLGLAERLELDVLAEGIETPEQAELLKNCGCRYAQGFGFARPMPMDRLQEFVSSLAPDRRQAAG